MSCPLITPTDGVAIDAPGAAVPIRTLHNIAKSQSVGLNDGCESRLRSGAVPAVSRHVSDAGQCIRGPDGYSLVTLQDGTCWVRGDDCLDPSVGRAAPSTLNARRRETCPVSDLVVGMQCGGSDALSGVTANPALGIAADMIVRAGGTAFREVTEVRTGSTVWSRAPLHRMSPKTDGMHGTTPIWVGAVRPQRQHNPRQQEGRAVEHRGESDGFDQQVRLNPLSGVVPAGERATRKGLLFAATPASDFICGTLQLAAGMNVHVFTTGRGTPYGLAEVPVIKVVTRTDLARRWHDLVDIDAGRVISANRSLEEMGLEMFEKILAVASGEKTCAERLGLSNQLALFNPGPVT